MVDASIARDPALPPALDYAFLRAEGLAHIQRLSGLLWTDHNDHDPGITILEVLCYALTDLAYRANFPVGDLLAGSDGELDPLASSSLSPAHEILPTAPRTIADYRRLLLHLDGVRNAWLDPMQDARDPAAYRQSEVPIYADRSAGTLSFDARDSNGKLCAPVKLSGLYKVQLELEIDAVFGSMNESALFYRVRRGRLKGAVLAFDCHAADFLAGRIDFTSGMSAIDAVELSATANGFDGELSLQLENGETCVLQACRIRIVEKRPRHDRPELEVDDDGVREVLLGTANDDLLPLFWNKQQRRARVLAAVSCVLHAHRGLCEDFLSITTVRSYHIGLCADIEVKPDTDLEAVQARVFHAIESYLSPPLRHRTLEEMLRAGFQPDEIFNGPRIDYPFQCDGRPVFTKSGFVTDADLAASALRREVQASDLIERIMDIDGVEAIHGVQLRPYHSSGEAAADAVRWTLPIPADHQAVFHVTGSKLLFRRAGIPYRARLAEFERTLDQLRALDRNSTHAAADQQLPMPRGRWRNLAAFHSIQNDFPATYKIGAARISASESPQRIARARQLKAYLAFFDHILAAYLGQLANLRRLYSLDRSLDRSMFCEALSGVAGSLKPDFADEFYFDDEDDGAGQLSWKQLGESKESFRERRSRLLDHLIARFAERFADYALLNFRLSGERRKSADELITDKIDFLTDYPRLSRERGQAANLRPQELKRVWNSDNVSGLERRIARLFGIANSSRRNLHCASHRASLLGIEQVGEAFRVVVRRPEGEPLFASAETFDSAAAAHGIAEEIYSNAHDESAYVVTLADDGAHFSLRIRSASASLTAQNSYDSEAAAWQAARALAEHHGQLLASADCDSEGMHLIEHVLLRPYANGDRLMQVCLSADGQCGGDEDPYSLRASVVLPYWPSRFRNADFRALLERSLREEAPAHVQLRICWIGQQQMIALDTALHNWLQARASAASGTPAVRSAAAGLIEVLESLRSVFPVAVLHDCDADGTQPVVRLGSTALGIF